MSKTMANLTAVTSGLGSAATVWVSDASLTPIDRKMTVGNLFADGPKRKNYIINGNMEIAQRGTAAVTASLSYPVDRFNVATVNNTFSAQQKDFANTDTLYATGGCRNYLEVDVTSSAAAGNYTALAQRIEDVTKLAGKTVTVSFYAKAASGTPLIGCEIFQNFGTGGSPSSAVTGTGQAITLSTTWTKYSLTFAIPSISGKTLGTTTNTSYTGLSIWLDAGADSNTRSGSIGQASKVVSITQVQLEEGSSATPFEYRPIAEELALCQRYYERIGGSVSTETYGAGMATSTTQALFMISYTQKRGIPSAVSFSAVDDFTVFYKTASLATTNMGTFAIGIKSVRVVSTSVASLTAGEAVLLRGEASTDHYIDINAEL